MCECECVSVSVYVRVYVCVCICVCVCFCVYVSVCARTRACCVRPCVFLCVKVSVCVWKWSPNTVAYSFTRSYCHWNSGLRRVTIQGEENICFCQQTYASGLLMLSHLFLFCTLFLKPRYEPNLCSSNCGPGYIGAGNFCWNLTSAQKKITDGEGTEPDACPASHPGKHGGFCYKNCEHGWTADGQHCVKE